jgi:amidase
VKRRELLVGGAAMALGATVARRARAASSSGSVPAVDAVKSSFARMDEVDAKIRSICERNPDALEIAAKLDAKKSGRGSLHGMPIVVKDNIDTADKMSTCAGSLALVGVKRAQDARCVALLRNAGAVIVGKANCSEWANFRSTGSVSGWSGRGGQTRNPHVLDRNPSGSSSGSAAAVAAGIVPAALGSETDGSITSPAAVCGVVGFKPTLDDVSSKGVIPISSKQDCVGPIARSVTECALVLGAIRDRGGRVSLDGATLKGKRIGVAPSLTGFHRDVDRLFDIAVRAMSDDGAVIVKPLNLDWTGAINGAEFLALQYECKRDLDAYLAALAPSSPVKSVADLVKWNVEHGKDELSIFGQEIFELVAAKGPLTTPEYLDARKKANDLAKAALDAVFHDVDVLVAPTQGPAWLIDDVNGDSPVGRHASAVAAVTGAPHCTVPMGFVHELPIGLSFIGRPRGDDDVLRIAFAFERATKAFREPKLLPTAPT